jgi:hypothetical protein
MTQDYRVDSFYFSGRVARRSSLFRPNTAKKDWMPLKRNLRNWSFWIWAAGYGWFRGPEENPPFFKYSCCYIDCKRGRGKYNQGIELGADEYVSKPFKPLEFIARTKKALKNHLLPGSNVEKFLDYGDLRIYIYEHKVQIGDRIIKLTSTESLILHYLISNAGLPVSHQSLAEHIWGNSYPDCNKAIRVFIRQLRARNWRSMPIIAVDNYPLQRGIYAGQALLISNRLSLI